MRYRSIKEALKELKKIDENTAISEYIIRKLAKDRKISQIISGTKVMVEVNSIIDYLSGKKFTPTIVIINN
jgi:hypothetical protein